MADTPAHPAVDPERTRPHNAFDRPDGRTGQEYDRTRDADQARADAGPAPSLNAQDGRDLPPDNGRRAWIAPNGEAHGSGMGAGGGAAGEDFDEGSPGAAPEIPQAGAAPDRE
ncbi:hypothetical protein ASG37_13825 [Sphingomonas sp. Leaf407]|uniref:hypothetical protein n=1 Tax=unclassified Sphingomonas TaxID=196159 RepID=UPI0006F687E4|nr:MULTISPECIES: hypothetical protein [unclassified Sphingomonas]KQN36654.1 hypothetical protein ASE97_13080 [Sphingomonas sp. Leaf42]KQT27276.1 hypothetical protein ASG37_13825 [Sphingomonas sp. Leaf407]